VQRRRPEPTRVRAFGLGVVHDISGEGEEGKAGGGAEEWRETERRETERRERCWEEEEEKVDPILSRSCRPDWLARCSLGVHRDHSEHEICPQRRPSEPGPYSQGSSRQEFLMFVALLLVCCSLNSSFLSARELPRCSRQLGQAPELSRARRPPFLLDRWSSRNHRPATRK
jgi:hypothetical protein